MDAIKHKYFGGVAVLALAALFVFLSASALVKLKEYKYVGAGIEAMNTISVSGEGEVFAVPDVAVFTLTIREEAKTAKEAQDIATKEINDVMEYLRKENIKENDIKTTSYNISPRYDWNNIQCVKAPCPERRTLRGYEVSQSVRVKVRDTDNAGEVLAGVGARGIDNVSGLSFEIDDDDALKAKARREAIADAKRKAEVLAKDLGVSIVRVAGFSEGGSNYAKPMYARMEMAMDGVGGGGAAPELPVGENKIASKVTITYEIR